MEIIWSIIGKKFAGEISDEESKILTEWLDSSTANKQTYLQLEELWNHKQDPSDFGELVTTQNIDAHLAKLRAERQRWRATHPADVAEIEALKK